MVDLVIVIVTALDALIFANLSGERSFINPAIGRLFRFFRAGRVVRATRIIKYFRDLRILMTGIIESLETLTSGSD